MLLQKKFFIFSIVLASLFLALAVYFAAVRVISFQSTPSAVSKKSMYAAGSASGLFDVKEVDTSKVIKKVPLLAEEKVEKLTFFEVLKIPLESLNVFNILIKLGAKIYSEQMNTFARTHTEHEASYVLSDNAINVKISNRLQNAPLVKSIEFKVTQSGCQGEIKIKVGSLEFKITGSGRIIVNTQANNHLSLELDYINIGTFKLPDSTLRDIEKTFAAVFAKQDPNAVLSRLQYIKGSVALTITKR
ncbi:MAG: hypothetical protein HQL28_03730 [Candidatus Omnitrophica bacterium]|nr:hypothetical protein [Candidatus Omnitrophota bacterium]